MKRLALIILTTLIAFACSKATDMAPANEQIEGTKATQDPVVLVHGNGTTTSSWNNTVSKLQSNGITQIYNVSWGTAYDYANNYHSSTNVSKVKTALQNAKNASSTGKVDVIGHSMGVTMAAEAIRQLGYQSKVNTFVGIAGALRGLNSCGVYPYNVATKACGSLGLSISNPFLNTLNNSLNSTKLASKVYSIKSYYDEVVCSPSMPTYCYVYYVHSSTIPKQNSSYTYNYYGHFNLQKYTYSKQYDLIKN